MANLELVSDFVCTVRDPSELIYGVTIEQVPGSENQARVNFKIPVTLQTGTIYARFIGNYNGTDGKQEIIQTSGFPIVAPVDGFGSGTVAVTLVSAANLVVGTQYHALIYWIEDGYAGDHWAVVQGEGFPLGNALVVSDPVTIQAIASAPTGISPGTITVSEGASAGTLIGTLSADILGCTFSEPAPDLAWAEIAADGTVTVADGQVAPAAGTYILKARATNNIGSVDRDITISVSAAGTGGSGDTVDIPAANVNTTPNSVAALQTILQAFETNFASARTTYGVATGEPVIRLAAGNYGSLDLSGFNLSQRVTVRGTGGYGFDGWVPTAGTKVGRLILNNANNVRVMGFQCEVASGTGHEMKNSTNCEIVRNTLAADPARSASVAGSSKGNVNDNLRVDGSVDCVISMNAMIGGVARVIGTVLANSDRIRCEWNVFDQGAGDCLNFNGGVNSNWEFHHNLGAGRGRLPQGTHQDMIQVRADGTAIAEGWNCTGNAYLTLPSFGYDSHAAQQMFWWGGGSQKAPTNVFTDNFTANTNGMVKNAQGNNAGTARFNTQWMCTDIPKAHASTYSCNWGGLENAQTADENIVPQKALSITKGAGPNGVHIYMPNSSYVENPTNDWGPQNGWTEGAVARNTMSFANCRPKVGTRAHWAHSDPTGCFRFFKRMYDATAHDHWKDKGWPIAPLCHEVYDKVNALGGTSGTYLSFDGNGVYLG